MDQQLRSSVKFRSWRLSPNISQQAEGFLGLAVLDRFAECFHCVTHSFSAFMRIVTAMQSSQLLHRAVIITGLETMKCGFGEVNKIVRGHRVSTWEVPCSTKCWEAMPHISAPPLSRGGVCFCFEQPFQRCWCRHGEQKQCRPLSKGASMLMETGTRNYSYTSYWYCHKS